MVSHKLVVVQHQLLEEILLLLFSEFLLLKFVPVLLFRLSFEFLKLNLELWNFLASLLIKSFTLDLVNKKVNNIKFFLLSLGASSQYQISFETLVDELFLDSLEIFILENVFANLVKLRADILRNDNVFGQALVHFLKHYYQMDVSSFLFFYFFDYFLGQIVSIHDSQHYILKL